MCQPIRGQGGHLVFPIGPTKKTQTWYRTLKSCFLSNSANSVQRFQRSRKCLSQSEARAAILFFRSARKNTNFVEDVEIFLPVKFPWFLFSSFGGEVENFSANHRPGRPSCFSDWSKKQKTWKRDVEIFLPVKFPWIPFSAKCLSQSEARAAILFLRSTQKNTNLVEGRWDLASCQVSVNSVQRFQRRSQKCLSQSQARAAILFFPSGPKNKNLVEDIEILLPVKFPWIPFSAKCLSQSEARAAILFLRSTQKTQNLVEDVEILLPVKFQWIRFSGFRGEVKNVSANQRLGRPSCFSERPKKQELGRGHWDLASCQVSVISVQRFQRRKSKMSQPIRG